jgi:hypothetical protein
MRFALFAFGLMISAQAFATSPVLPSAPVADCSKASKGIVKITTQGQLITSLEAARVAYSQCLVSTKSIGAARANAVKKSKLENENACGKSGELQVIERSSWIGERASMGSNGKLYNGGDSQVIVVDSIVCTGMGTGLFSGTVEQIAVRMNETHWNTFSDGDDNDTNQTFEFSDAMLVKLP